MATPMFPDEPNYFGEDVVPDIQFGLAEIDALKPVEDENNNLMDDENPFKSANASADEQNDSYQASAEELHMAACIQNFLNRDSDGEEDKHVLPRYDSLSSGPTIDPKLLTYSSAAEAEMFNTPLTPLWLGGDGHNSSPDQPADAGNGSNIASSPVPEFGNNVIEQQDEPMKDQNNTEEHHADNASVPATNNVVEASNERLPHNAEQAGSYHAIQSVGVSSATNISSQHPSLNPNELIAYSWQMLQMNKQIPPVLKTLEAYHLIRDMVMDGGKGLESGITAENIVALPRVQQFLANVMKVGNPFPSANSVTTNPLISRNSDVNTEAFNANANNLASYSYHQPSVPTNFATGGSGHPSSLPNTQRSAVENIVQRLGGYQAFRERYIQWRTMALRPISTADLSTLNVLVQPDMEQFLRSMDIQLKTNMQPQSSPLPIDRSRAAKNGSGPSQHRRTASKATANKPSLDTVPEEPSGITDAEAKALVQKHIDKYRKHPAAVNPTQAGQTVSSVDHEKLLANGNQRTSSPKTKASRSTKSATRKKSSTPTKVPKKVHPNAVMMYKFFGAPVPGEEEPNSDQNVQDQTAAQTNTTTAHPQQIKSTNDAPQIPIYAPIPGAQPAVPYNFVRMNNASQPMMSTESMSQRLMLEVRELQRLLRDRDLIIKNQHGVIKSQQGAIDAQKQMFQSMLSQFNTNRSNVSVFVPGQTSGVAYPGAVSTTEGREDHSFRLKRSVSVAESSITNKRRRGAAGLTLRATAGENSMIRDMANPSMQIPVAGHTHTNAQSTLFANGSHNIGTVNGTVNGTPDTMELHSPFLIPRRRSNRVLTTVEEIYNNSKGNAKEESPDGSNEPAESSASGSDYVPS